MFNLGIDGDDGVSEQHAVSRQLAQYQERMMASNPNINTTNINNPLPSSSPLLNNNNNIIEDEEPSPRGEEHTPIINILTNNLLRTSFSLKTLSISLMSLFFLAFGGRWIFTFHSHPDMTNGFHLSMAILMIIQLIGTIGLSFFQAFVADDSK